VPLRQTLLALTLAFGTITPVFAQQSQLPATLPGLGRDEGVFLVTAADDGSRAVYFIAQNARHAILDVDLQVEQRINPLWPMRLASRDEVLSFTEGAPIGNGRVGLLGAPAAVAEAPVEAEIEEDADVADVVNIADVADVVEIQVQSSTYTLRPGDNLTYIARDHGTTVQAILQANGISNANRIYAGQSLVIPGTVSEVTAQEPTEETEVAEQPALEAVAPETASEAMTYTVKRGDSAIGIARQLGVDLDELLAANGVANRNRIYAGQLLTVPAQSS
jgi:LysM repeat protein